MPNFTPARANLTVAGQLLNGDQISTLDFRPGQADLLFDLTAPGQFQAIPPIQSDVIISEGMALGAIGGPSFNTTIHQLFSGLEERNVNWVRPRQRWTIGYNIRTLADLQEVVDLFYITRGRGYGFLFKDWSDYLSNGAPTDPPTAVTDADQNIGTGDGVETEFQITKTYQVASRIYIRNITRPKNTTVLVAVDAVAQTEVTHYTIDYDTGIISFVTPPGNGLAVTCGYEFYVTVRFDVDQLDKQIATFWLGEVPSIPIIELLE
jgi:uncharacterized protein (TIGR02217 family)